MKTHAFPLLISATLCALPGWAHAQACLEGAADMGALIQCVKNEVEPVERKVELAFERQLARYRAEPALLSAAQKTRSAWDAYRDAQCSFEGQARPAAAAAKSLELQRGIMLCVRRAYEQRLRELE